MGPNTASARTAIVIPLPERVNNDQKDPFLLVVVVMKRKVKRKGNEMENWAIRPSRSRGKKRRRE